MRVIIYIHCDAEHMQEFHFSAFFETWHARVLENEMDDHSHLWFYAKVSGLKEQVETQKPAFDGYWIKESSSKSAEKIEKRYTTIEGYGIASTA